MSGYLFDSNVFIQAKTLHYQFGFCQGFWDWISRGHGAGLFFSSKKVLAELNRGNETDEARRWAGDAPNGFFLDDASVPDVMTHYGHIMNWAYASNHFLPQAKEEFAREDEADAFLIALAAQRGWTIVTHEKSNPDKRNRILIPDAAIAHGVPTIIIYDLLRQKARSTFEFNHP